MLTPVRTDVASVARTDPAAPRTYRLQAIGLVAIIALGALLRFMTIAHQSYWVDEATTVHEVQLSLGALLHQVHVNETTPPLYFLLAWVWAKLFGTSELGLRSLSALLGIGLIPTTYACARELVSRGAGLLAAALAAVSPFLIWYSQETRSYALFALLCGLSFLYFARLRRTRGTRDLVLWATFSILAVLTHFFAGFLIAPEALTLLWWLRSRAAVVAAGAVALVQLALLPLAAGDTSHPLQWIKAFPLSTRIQQVPVDFALSSLYQSQIVTYGLIGAGVLIVALVVLLWAGGGPERRAGAAPAAAVAGFVIVVPILLAWLGRDYLVPRNLIAAWVPLVVVIAAACLAPRTLPFGAVLAVVLLGGFVYAGFKINATAQYERPDWRGVARALGSSSAQRAIVAYDSSYATQPLSLYLPRIPWTQRISGPVSVGEVDVVANAYNLPSASLPAGVRHLSSTTVSGFLVVRYGVSPGWRLTPAAIVQRASALVAGGGTPGIVIQPGPA
jgi:uncharacterized membrane protein